MANSNSDSVFAPARQRLQTHLTKLCSEIGERRAGSRGDRETAEYMLHHFRQAGLQSVHAEEFPCVWVAEAQANIAIGTAGQLRDVPARVLAGSPGTPGPASGELVWIEMPEQAERLFQPTLRSKIVVLFGPMPTRADLHQRLVKFKPAVVVHVDDRLPFEWVKDDGVYPVWARRYGMPPTVTIPYQLAWDLRKAGADSATAQVTVELKKTTSKNIVSEIPGRRSELPLVLVSAHHDTQCNNTGADDNASGVVALLELATLLTQSRPLRTIRLVSFGAEEQLSVGSACYVAAHRREMRGIGAVLNLDSLASPLGHHWVIRAGPDGFGTWLLRRMAKAGLDAVEKTGPMPFADHFPFSTCGVPSVTLMRPNMDSGMRWQHHSAQDNLENVSLDEMAKVIKAVAEVTVSLARSTRWPFGRGVAPAQRAETARMAKELFGF
jgi:hypothetical protein